MAQSRAYVPSVALIRALTRPQPLRCPFARTPSAQFARGKKTKARKAREAEEARLAYEARKAQRAKMSEEQREQAELDERQEDMVKEMRKNKAFGPIADKLETLFADMKDPDKLDKIAEPQVLPEGTDMGHFYEVDYHTGKRRKVDLFGTREDQIKAREEYFMMKERDKNPDFDDAELRKRQLDGLMRDSAFADLTEELKEIKEGIMTKEETQKAIEEHAKEVQPEIDEMNTVMRDGIRSSLTTLMNDPNIGEERADLQAVLDYLPNVEDFGDPKFGALMDRATERVNNNPKLRAKIEAATASETPEQKEQYEAFQRELEELTTDPNTTGENMRISDEELDELMLEMQGMLGQMNLDGDLDSQFKRMLAETDPEASMRLAENASDEDLDRIAKLPAAIERLAGGGSESGPKSSETDDEDEYEHMPPELRAQVDKLMADPRLMEKLNKISKLIEEQEAKRDSNDLTQIDADLAPDPYEMEDSRTATLSQRMASARASPEHSAAMRALRVKLDPPYSISPALKSFNQAIEFAYVGANDDVRRVLWRTYQKARTLPTFLQKMSDDAWDILYYSQAVVWAGNQNRTDHLKMLLKDLKTAGKEGPPTHPSELGQHQEAARLEAAQREQREATTVEGEVVDSARVA